MKKILQSITRRIAAVARHIPLTASLLIAVMFLSIFVLPPVLPAQDVPYTTGTLTLSTNLVAASTDATVTSSALRLRGNQGVALLPSFTLAAPGCASNLIFRFTVSTDGTTWTTTTPFTATIAANSTNAAVGYVNFDRGQDTSLNNIRWMRLASVCNTATNAVTLNSLTYSYFNR